MTRATAWLAALAALPLAFGGAAPAQAAATCSATYSVDPRYTDGVVTGGYIYVTVTNLRAVNTTGWRLTAKYPNTFTTDLYWNATLLSPDLIGTVSLQSYNFSGALQPGGSASTGLRVKGPAGTWPAPVSLTCVTTI